MMVQKVRLKSVMMVQKVRLKSVRAHYVLSFLYVFTDVLLFQPLIQNLLLSLCTTSHYCLCLCDFLLVCFNF